MPRPGQVLGLVGTNGIGKSTALKILAGKLKPNLGRYDSPPDWQEILQHFRGSELQNYFTKILEENLKAIIKPQYVDHIPRAVQGLSGDILASKAQIDDPERLYATLDLTHVLNREVENLSGGELQRFAICIVAVQVADVYMFDEPSSYLDVRQRMKAAGVIRSLASGPSTYVVTVEHDLSVLDYLSDYICCLYGSPAHYGVVTMPFSVREGINIFLAGFVPTENLRFRDVELTFKVSQNAEEVYQGENVVRHYSYPSMSKTLMPKNPEKKKNSFTLHVEAGDFSNSEIIVLLGENGTGKTTFIRMLAGLQKSDEQVAAEEAGDMDLAMTLGVPQLNVSYKPQKISPKFAGTVRQLLHNKVRDAFMHPQFQTDVARPLKLDNIIDQGVQHLSGGEIQRVAIIMALGLPADIYLVDEPSAYLDSEQRIICAKVIKRFIIHAKKTGFVVEHDFIMATYLADRVVVYTGQPGIECTAQAPEGLLSGMNSFLSQLEITFRRDPTNYRPRINKPDSIKDREQKESGNYFFMDD